MGLQLVGLDLVFYGESQWLQFMYIKHVIQYYSICFMDQEHKNQLGYFGRVSGRDENKMEKCGMTVNNQDVAPYFEESSVVILCKVMGKSDFDQKSVDENVYEWYQEEGVHSQYYGEIVKVLVKVFINK